MSKMKIRPTGNPVPYPRHPSRKKLTGEAEVETSPYWMRRLVRGEIELVPDPPKKKKGGDK